MLLSRRTLRFKAVAPLPLASCMHARAGACPIASRAGQAPACDAARDARGQPRLPLANMPGCPPGAVQGAGQDVGRSLALACGLQRGKAASCCSSAAMARSARAGIIASSRTASCRQACTHPAMNPTSWPVAVRRRPTATAQAWYHVHADGYERRMDLNAPPPSTGHCKPQRRNKPWHT